MKRICIFFIAAVLLLSLQLLMGCGGNATVQSSEDAPVQGIGESEAAAPSDEAIAMLMEVFGFSEEALAAMEDEQISAMLDELGYAMGENDAKTEVEQNKAQVPTLADVSVGGSYVVTIGDSMMWNYLELYYEDGVLQKIVTNFQKNDEEEAESEVLEGEAARSYAFYWIDFAADPATIAQKLEEEVGYTHVYINSVK